MNVRMCSFEIVRVSSLKHRAHSLQHCDNVKSCGVCANGDTGGKTSDEEWQLKI